MKTKLAEFLLMEEEELKGAFISLLIAIPTSYLAFKFIMLPFGWWLL